MHILKRDDSKIEREIANLEAVKTRFQKFLHELSETGFSFTVKEFQDLCYGTTDSLITWLKERTLSGLPAWNKMPIKHEAKLEMLELPPYTSLLEAHRDLRDKREVFSFDLMDSELIISDSTRQQITDKFTIYGTDDDLEMLKICESIKEKCEQAKINPLRHPSLLSVNGFNGSITILVDRISNALNNK